VHGALGRYAASGHLVYVTSGGIMMAAPFDIDGLRITGEAVPIAQAVAVRALSRADVAISPSGTMVFASGSVTGGSGELIWVTRDGKVTPVDSQFTRFFAGPIRLSPDGRQVAVTVIDPGADISVWVKRLDHGPAARVMMSAGSAAWSPDGRMLLASSSAKLIVGPSDASTLPTTIDVGHTAPATPVFSPDGKWMVYVQQGDIYARSAVASDTTRISLVSGGHHGTPAISPDGHWLAYMSDESGRQEIYVRPFPDTRISKRQVSVAGGISPHWSRDGRELFFVDESRHMVVVSVTPGPTFFTSEPKQVFDAAMAYAVAAGVPFDVAPDGRFLTTRMAGGASAHADELILVENFFEDLKAKTKQK
jgi:Tol biopolymer transport system component